MITLQTGVYNSQNEMPKHVALFVIFKLRFHVLRNHHLASPTAGTAPLHVRLDVAGATIGKYRALEAELWKPRSFVDGRVDHEHRAGLGLTRRRERTVLTHLHLHLFYTGARRYTTSVLIELGFTPEIRFTTN